MKKFLYCLSVIYCALNGMASIISSKPIGRNSEIARNFKNACLKQDLTEYKKNYPYIISPLFYRVIEISRETNKKEKCPIENLKKFTSNIGIKEFRIIDAYSYVNGLKDCLPNDIYNLLLKFLKPYANIDEIFNTLDKILQCDDKFFKASLFNEMKYYTKKSNCYKQMVIAYIAFGYSIDYLYDYNPWINDSNITFSLSPGEVTQHHKGNIKINLNEKNFFRSLFYSSFNDYYFKSNLYVYSQCNALKMYHEMGHCIDFFNFLFHTRLLNMENIVPKFLNIQVNKQDWQSYEEHVRLKSINSAEDFINFVKLIDNSVNNLENALSKMQTNISNKIDQAKLSFHNNMEFWQIIGLTLVKPNLYNTSKAMFINKLSDLALHTELGLPIRHDHLGYTYKELTNSEIEYYNTSSIFSFNIPYKAYGIMMEIYNSSWDQYTGKLLYPYGLAGIAEAEYKLAEKTLLKQLLKYANFYIE